MLRLDDKYDPLDVRLDVQLLRTVINVNQKQVVKQQVLDKIVLVKALLISYQQVLNLKCCHLADHVYVFASALGKKYIF